MAQTGKVLKAVVLGLPEWIRGGAGSEDMQSISRGFGGAAGGGAVAAVVRDSCSVLTVMEMGGDAVDPRLGSDAEEVLHAKCAGSEVGGWLVQGPSEGLLQVEADVRPQTAGF